MQAVSKSATPIQMIGNVEMHPFTLILSRLVVQFGMDYLVFITWY